MEESSCIRVAVVFRQQHKKDMENGEIQILDACLWSVCVDDDCLSNVRVVLA
jgi:hypothetical protein